jgi:hypothetical protein
MQTMRVVARFHARAYAVLRAASFRTMLREKPKLALWTVHNHPLAFGEPTGIGKRGLQWKDVRELVPSSEKKDAPARTVLPRSLDPVLDGERKRIREQAIRARVEQAAKRAPATIAASSTAVAERLEREAPSDADTAKQAAHIREVARELRAEGAPTRDQAQDQRQRIEATRKDPAVLYKELEDQLRQRDRARGKQEARHRGNNGRDG